MKVIKNLFLLVLGAVAGIVAFQSFAPKYLKQAEMTPATQQESKKPLYWVAPMDPNFKSDKPGKSPMGMDLIPVYADEDNNSDAGPGTVKISPDVINNIGVRVTKVMRKALHNRIQTVGYVQYDEDQLIHVHPRVEGWVENLYVKATGDPVKRGQALYTLYSPTLVNAQEEYLIALQRKNGRLIEAAQARLRALQLSRSFIGRLKKTRQVKQKVTFYAPKSGVIARLNIREGYFVKPGTSMMAIGILDDVWVEAEIFERQAALVKVGLPVTMTLSYIPGREWLGKVDYIYPTLDPNTRTLRVRLRFNNTDNVLMPNMYTQVTIHAQAETPRLLLPKEAVIRTGKQDRVVLALGEGRFKSVAVKTGRSDGQYIEILEGLSEGEEVVSSAQFLIDSESSKTSDFRRMNHEMKQISGESVWVRATIHSVMPQHKMINVSHQPIPQWQWPAMTMDLMVEDTVDLAQYKAGDTVEINITKTAGSHYKVSDIKVISPESEETALVMHAEVDGTINRVMPEHRMLNISRGPIPKWNREAATMDFMVDQAVDMRALKPGMRVHFRFIVNSGQFVITKIQPKEAKK